MINAFQFLTITILLGSIFGISHFDENIKDRTLVKFLKAFGISFLSGFVFTSWFLLIWLTM